MVLKFVYRLVIEDNQKNKDYINLLSPQKHYLQRVLRLKVGDNFVAINGKGNSWIVELTVNGGKVVQNLSDDNELPVSVTLVVALPKGNGFEEIVRCGTELGVNQFMPIISERTLLKPRDNKLKRWRKIAIEAAEQSERQILPYIFPPMSFNQAIKEINNLNAYYFFCVARKKTSSFGKNIQDISQLSPKPIVIATGPEGGWTDREIEIALANNFQLVSLGKRILRAVTAPIMAMSIVAGVFD